VRRLVIVQCGGAKIWDKQPNADPTPARDAYTSVYFQLNREYADKFANHWVILSAKYGFIEPDFIIPQNYNVTFKRKRTNPISVRQLRDQVRAKKLAHFGLVEVLGGLDYYKQVKEAFAGTDAHVRWAFQGLEGIGYFMQRVRRAIDESVPISLPS